MDIIDKIHLESKYNSNNIKLYQLMKNNEYFEALNIVKNLISLSKQLKQEKLELESTLNLGLCLLFSGKFLDSIEIFENTIKISSQILNHLTELNIDIINYKLRAYANVVLACIASDKLEEADKYFEMLCKYYEELIKYKDSKIESKAKNDNNISILKSNDDSNINGNVELRLSQKDNLTKLLTFNFFGFDSIREFIKNKDINDNNNEEEEDTDTKHIKSIQSITYKFYTMLLHFDKNKLVKSKENDDNDDINSFLNWVKSLKTEASRFKQNKDFYGFLFTNLNYNLASIISNDSKFSNKEKNKVNSLFGILIKEYNKENKQEENENNNEKEKEESITNDYKLESIIQSFKTKLEISSKICKRLFIYETEINKLKESQKAENNTSQLSEEQIISKINQSKKQVMKIFINFSISKLMSEIENDNEKFFLEDKNVRSSIPFKNNVDMIKQLEFVLEILDNPDIDVSDIDLDSIDPEIFKSLRILYRNLCMIKYKTNILGFFKKFKLNTLGYSSRKALIEEQHLKFTMLLKAKLNSLRTGMTLTKFNYSSSGTKDHYYQVSLDESCLKIYEKEGSKNFSKIYFSEIKRFSYGVGSKNLLKKMKTKDFNGISTWECFSIRTSKRTLDFCAEEKDIDTWYYGIKHIFDYMKNKDPKLICSVSHYRLMRLKMKLVEKLKELYLSDTGKDKVNERDVELINKILNEYKETGVKNFSILKLFLLVNKLKPIIQ